MSDAQHEEIERFAPPSNALGLRPLFPNEEDPLFATAKIDVVAVHGLGGDAYGTWAAEDGKIWLRDLLPAASAGPGQNPFERARIFTYGYDSRAFLKPFKTESNGRTFLFAERLLEELDSYRDSATERHRPIIFVGHSMGGIVIKKALCNAKSRDDLYGDILRSTKSVVFFGTPHGGSSAASWAGLLGKVGRVFGIRSTKVIKDLETWSDALVELSTSFCVLPRQYGIDVQTYFETLKTHSVQVVEEGSARIGIPEEKALALATDHLQICKFMENDDNWRTVKRQLGNIARKVVVPEKAERISSAMPSVPTVPVTGPGDDAAKDDSLWRRYDALRN